MIGNETLSFFVYMWNSWSLDECLRIFDGNINHENVYSLGHHIWGKWESAADNYGVNGAIAPFMSQLDTGNFNKIVARACELYDGRHNR